MLFERAPDTTTVSWKHGVHGMIRNPSVRWPNLNHQEPRWFFLPNLPYPMFVAKKNWHTGVPILNLRHDSGCTAFSYELLMNALTSGRDTLVTAQSLLAEATWGTGVAVLRSFCVLASTLASTRLPSILWHRLEPKDCISSRKRCFLVDILQVFNGFRCVIREDSENFTKMPFPWNSWDHRYCRLPFHLLKFVGFFSVFLSFSKYTYVYTHTYTQLYTHILYKWERERNIYIYTHTYI